jgi:hypothetical protein
MLIAAWHVIRTEQKRNGQPRRGIIVFTSVFMGFCLLLSLLSAFVQLREHAEARSSQEKMQRIKAAVGPLLDTREFVINSLPENSPQKATLQKISQQLKEIFPKDGND